MISENADTADYESDISQLLLWLRTNNGGLPDVPLSFMFLLLLLNHCYHRTRKLRNAYPCRTSGDKDTAILVV